MRGLADWRAHSIWFRLRVQTNHTDSTDICINHSMTSYSTTVPRCSLHYSAQSLNVFADYRCQYDWNPTGVVVSARSSVDLISQENRRDSQTYPAQTKRERVDKQMLQTSRRIEGRKVKHTLFTRQIHSQDWITDIHSQMHLFTGFTLVRNEVQPLALRKLQTDNQLLNKRYSYPSMLSPWSPSFQPIRGK